MITGLSVADFKPFGQMQHVPHSKITLLFGANSTGKSRLVHALALLRAALVWPTTNTLTPSLGMDDRKVLFDIGPLSSVVFRQELSRTISIQATLNLGAKNNCRFAPAGNSLPETVTIAIALGHPPACQPAIVAIRLIDTALDQHVCSIVRAREGEYTIDEIVPRYFLPPDVPADTKLRLHQAFEGRHVRIESMNLDPAPDSRWSNRPSSLIQVLDTDQSDSGQDSDAPAPGVRRSADPLDTVSSILTHLLQQLDSVVHLSSDRTYAKSKIILHEGGIEFTPLDWAWLGLLHDEVVSSEVERWLQDPKLLNTPYQVRLVDAPSGEGWNGDWSQIVFHDTRFHMSLLHAQVGFGLSQIIPVLATLRGDGVFYSIDQPELHLHPRLQTELGDVFIRSVRTRGNRYLLETHSEHLLLRLLRRIRETQEGEIPPDSSLALYPEDLSVVVLQATDAGTKIHQVAIDGEGELLDPWPGGFFAERRQELM